MSFSAILKKLLEKSKIWIGFLLGILFLYLAIRNTDFNKFIEKIKSVNLIPVILIIGLRSFALLVRGLRWKIVLNHIKDISTIRLFRIASIGEMGNYVLPARIGELMRIYIVSKKEEISKSAVLASVFADRLFDFISVVLIFFTVSAFVSIPYFTKDLSIITIIFTAILICGLFLLYKYPLKISSGKIVFLPHYVAKIIIEVFTRFRNALLGLKEPKRILQALTVSLFLWGIHITSFYLVIVALDLKLTWYISALISAIIALGMILPSTPGYVGTYEFFCVSSLTFFAIDKNSALACAVISHGLQYIVVIVVGIICYILENISFSRVISDNRQVLNV